MKELKGLQDSVKEIDKLFTDYEDMLLLIEMSEGEDEEQEAAEEIEEELGTFEEVFEKLRISTLLIGPYDADNAIVTLHAGAGGTEAMDWTSMLYRMYSRWAEKRGYEVEVLDYRRQRRTGCRLRQRPRRPSTRLCFRFLHRWNYSYRVCHRSSW